MEFTTMLYQQTQDFPREEIFGLTNQLRKAAVSIPSNIAEGYGRSSNTELLRFLYISLGSCNEIETQLQIAFNIGYLSDASYKQLYDSIHEIGLMLRSLIKNRQKS